MVLLCFDFVKINASPLKFDLHIFQRRLTWLLISWDCSSATEVMQKAVSKIDRYLTTATCNKSRCVCIWVRSLNCGCLVTWFCYQLIAKPGNKTAAVSWPDPFIVGWLPHMIIEGDGGGSGGGFTHTVIKHSLHGNYSSFVTLCKLPELQYILCQYANSIYAPNSRKSQDDICSSFNLRIMCKG